MLPEFLAGRAEASVSFFQEEIEVVPGFFIFFPNSCVLISCFIGAFAL